MDKGNPPRIPVVSYQDLMPSDREIEKDILEVMHEAIYQGVGLPPALMGGINYSSSRAALNTFSRKLGIGEVGLPGETIPGGSWLGEVQSP